MKALMIKMEKDQVLAVVDGQTDHIMMVVGKMASAKAKVNL
jgi:hypothetical protein